MRQDAFQFLKCSYTSQFEATEQPRKRIGKPFTCQVLIFSRLLDNNQTEICDGLNFLLTALMQSMQSNTKAVDIIIRITVTTITAEKVGPKRWTFLVNITTEMSRYLIMCNCVYFASCIVLWFEHVTVVIAGVPRTEKPISDKRNTPLYTYFNSSVQHST